MATPIFASASSVSTAINICTIIADSPGSRGATTGQNSGAMLDLVSYYIAGGSSGVGTVATFQELGTDGTWRPLVTNPAPVTIANSVNVNLSFSGPFHGLRIAVSNPVGNGIAYAELKGCVRNN